MYIHSTVAQKVRDAITLQIIEELEARLAGQGRADSARHEKEMKKMRLKYEILARTEVNSRLSEINKFLSDKSKEHERERQSRDTQMTGIQADYAKRLQQSREELAQIKDDLQG